MNSESNLEKEIFGQALELPADKRAEYVSSACRGDEALRRRVEDLLRVHQAATGVLKTEAEASDSGVFPIREGPGSVIGRYKLLQRIGEGGMGVVYMAEQLEPVRRQIALKIIKLGMDTRSVVARFEAERQALAMMDHPHIAKVLDAGATDTGRPFFVMELVRGVPITEYCDKNHLPAPERLQLFVTVCQAIQHAHQKGIIHRDIKPTNVLVTLNDGVPHPIVIDFGIAKATNQRLTEKTLFTNFAQMVGTPAYMSPEQAEMSKLDVDTRSDIYSLGVLLYELLTGTTPFTAKDLLSEGYGAMQRLIVEAEPPRPSTRLSTMRNEERTIVARNRSVEAGALARMFKGDLDWVVMKCLEKDRTRRYETANGLAVDIKRHLQNEPVVARPPSAAYRFQKLVRRNKVAAVALAAVAMILVTALAAISVALIREREARIAAARAEQVQARLRASADEAREAAERAQTDEAAAHRRETELRKLAEAQLYATDVFHAQQALAKDQFARARELLARHIPRRGETNRPGWEWRYLWGQCRSDELIKVCQKPAFITSIATSYDRKHLALAWLAGGVSVLDISNLHSPKEVAEFSTGGVGAVAFAPASGLLAYSQVAPPTSGDVGGGVSSVVIWSVDTQRSVGTLTNVPGLCMTLVFSSDAKNLFVYRKAGQQRACAIDLWRWSDSTRLLTYENVATNIIVAGSLFALSGDQQTMAVAGDSLTVRDVATGRSLWKAPPLHRGFHAAVVSPGGRTLVTAEDGTERMIRIWDLQSGKELGRRPSGHRSGVPTLQLSTDGKILVTGSNDQTARLWDISNPAEMKELGRPFQGHAAGLTTLRLLPDDKTVISASMDGAVHAWDLTRTRDYAKPIVLPPVSPWWFEFTADSKSVVTLDGNGQAVQWSGIDFQRREPLFSLGGRHVKYAVFSRDAHFLAVGSTNGVVDLWDVGQRRRVREFGGTAGDVDPTIFSPDNARLLVLDKHNASFAEWDLQKFEQTRTFSLPVQRARVAWSLSPDWRWLLAATVHGECTLSDTHTGWQLNRKLDIQNLTDTTFSPDGKWFAATSQLGYTAISETESFRPVFMVGDRSSPINTIKFSRDGSRLIAAGSSSKAVRIWDVATQLELLELGVKGTMHYGSKFSPDGNVLASVGESVSPADAGLFLWRAPSWDEVERTIAQP